MPTKAERESRRETIERLYETGVPKAKIARDMGISVSYVERALAISRPRAAPEVIQPGQSVLEDSRLRWNVERRTRLGAAIFERVEALLPGIESARELKDLSIAFAVMTDKMRLESDQSTQNVAISTNDHLTDAERAAIRVVLEGR